jgi:transcriptional regulator with XRE-family HTH domain
MQTAPSWPELIRQIRAVRRWSQEALAEQMQTDQATVSRWERGIVQPGFAAQRKLEFVAQEAGLQSLNGIERVVQCSPYPMLLVDRNLQVIAASASSGFLAGQSVVQQTPHDERAYLKSFAASLEEGGFWRTDAQSVIDYAFERGTEIAGAVVVRVTARGEVYAVVQKQTG